MFLNGYPYTDFHEMNLDFLLKSMKTLKQAFTDFTASNSLIFAEPLLHNITSTYAKNTIVLDSDGNAYISLQNVPSGVQLSNADYWLMVFNFEEYTEKANKNFTNNYFRDMTRAPYALSVGDWVVLNDVLYEVTVAIAADGLFEIGTNLVHFTVEQFLKDFISSVNQTLTNWYNQMTGTINQYKNDIDASELLYRQQLAQDIADTTASLQAQLNLAISGATVDSEVINARLGADGVTYPTLGDAIRTQFTDTNDRVSFLESATLLAEYTDSDMSIDGWLDYIGVLHAGGYWRSSDFINIANKQPTYIYFKLYGQYTDSTNYVSNIAFYDSDDNIVDTVHYGSSSSGIEWEDIIKIPSIAAKMKICSHSEHDFDHAVVKVYYKPDTILTDDNDIFNSAYIHNALNDFNYAGGFYHGYLNSSGNTNPASTWRTTSSFVDCTKFNRCSYRLRGMNAACLIAMYDANQHFIKGIMGSSSSYTMDSGVVDISDISYLKICYYMDVSPFADENMYCNLYNLGNDKPIPDYHNITNKPYTFTGNVSHFFGDSIVVGYTSPGTIASNPWPKRFSESVGMTYSIKAVGGATFYPVTGYSDVLTQIQNDDLTGVNNVFIAAGINDWQLGVDPDDTYSAVDAICSYLSNNYSGRVIFILPINEGGKQIATPPIASLDAYRKVIGDVVTYYNYDLINGKFFNFPDKDGDPQLITRMYGDRLHPSEFGYSVYARAMKSACL